MRSEARGTLPGAMRRLAFGLVCFAFAAGARPASAVTRAELLSAATRVADRLASVKPTARNWEDVPYLSGVLLLAAELERDRPGDGARFVSIVEAAVGGGNAVVTHGDYAGYAQAALDLYSRTAPSETERRATLLATTDGPLAFARRALRETPSDSSPVAPWWVEGGYGVRFWQDDPFTLPPGLARRGSSRDGLPGDAEARDLAYEWIEAYVFDHRPATSDGRERAVPSVRSRAGFLLWDPLRELFRHDPAGTADGPFWGRGNGWVGFGLATSARFLEEPYGGDRYEAVLDRPALRGLLARLAGSLAALRTSDAGWGTDLLDSGSLAAESSATGLITFFLARGVNEGWLDREAYRPVVLAALALLLSRVDAEGDVAGIQPPGTGPDGAVASSDDPSVNLNYGVGAFLLAVVEASRLPPEDLDRMDEEAGRPVEMDPFRRTRVVAVPPPLEPEELRVAKLGDHPVRAEVERRDLRGLRVAPTEEIRIEPGSVAGIALEAASDAGATAVVTVRATGDVGVVLLARGGTTRRAPFSPDGDPPLRPLRSIESVPLHEALAGRELAEARVAPAGLAPLGASNPGPAPATLRVEVRSAGGELLSAARVPVPPLGAAFVRRSVPPGATVRFFNETEGGVLLPVLAAPE